MSWAEVEYGDGDLGDPRRTRRLMQMAEARAERPSALWPQGFASAAARTGADELCENALIDLADILAGHFGARARRMVAEPLVLALEDPTEGDESEHSATRGVGMLQDTQPRGWLIHTTLAVTPRRGPLGLIDPPRIDREAEQFGQRPQRRARPLEAKESCQGLNTLEATIEIQAQCPLTRIVSGGDREADGAELFLERATRREDVLVRGTGTPPGRAFGYARHAGERRRSSRTSRSTPCWRAKRRLQPGAPPSNGGC